MRHDNTSARKSGATKAPARQFGRLWWGVDAPPAARLVAAYIEYRTHDGPRIVLRDEIQAELRIGVEGTKTAIKAALDAGLISRRKSERPGDGGKMVYWAPNAAGGKSADSRREICRGTPAENTPAPAEKTPTAGGKSADSRREICRQPAGNLPSHEGQVEQEEQLKSKEEQLVEGQQPANPAISDVAASVTPDSEPAQPVARPVIAKPAKSRSRKVDSAQVSLLGNDQPEPTRRDLVSDVIAYFNQTIAELRAKHSRPKSIGIKATNAHRALIQKCLDMVDESDDGKVEACRRAIQVQVAQCESPDVIDPEAGWSNFSIAVLFAAKNFERWVGRWRPNGDHEIWFRKYESRSQPRKVVFDSVGRNAAQAEYRRAALAGEIPVFGEIVSDAPLADYEPDDPDASWVTPHDR